MTVSKRLRYEILRRDNHTCRYCGATAPDASITIDHVTPTALGGTDEPNNLVAACQECNAGKSSICPDAPLVADVAQSALRWKIARDTAAELMSKDRQARDAFIMEMYDNWHLTWVDIYGLGKFPPLPSGWEDSVERWHDRGLPLAVLTHFIEVAARKFCKSPHMRQDEVWRYYAGCCWSALTELENSAQALIDEGTV